MKIYTTTDLENYMKDDWIYKLLDPSHPGQSNKWLLELPVKRMIWADMYGDLLNCDSKKILDIGGGHSTLTDILEKLHTYVCLDFLASSKSGINTNWDCWKNQRMWDVIIANDIFPNVDQRLEMFLDMYLSKCKEMRTCLSLYNRNSYYLKVSRIGGDEIYHWKAADGAYCWRQVEKFLDHIVDFNFTLFFNCSDSLFANGRTVLRCDFIG